MPYGVDSRMILEATSSELCFNQDVYFWSSFVFYYRVIINAIFFCKEVNMFQQPGNVRMIGRTTPRPIHGSYKPPPEQIQHSNIHQTNFPNQGKYLASSSQIHNGGGCMPTDGTGFTITNRAMKFNPPLKKVQSANMYADTNQMSTCNNNSIIPVVFQNTSKYKGPNQRNNGNHLLEPNSEMMPKAGRILVHGFHQDQAIMVLLRKAMEVVFQAGKMPDSHGIYAYSSTMLQDSAPQLLRPITSTAPTVEIENTNMSTLTIDESQCNSIINNLTHKIFGSTEREKIFIFTGTVEKVIKWNKIFCNHFCYFEVIASVVSIQEGSVRTQKVMLLRDKKGPVLQVVYYLTTHLDLQDFYIGQMLRCVGKMNGQNVLNAVSIKGASQEEVDNLQRLCLICDQAVSHYLND
ncbi:hypothetical protein JTB14_018324 [Gonioctena quinquepunctata]|nr:hypothetical protein JTB14_018324 [Gonioctena quinquepunctata]